VVLISIRLINHFSTQTSKPSQCYLWPREIFLQPTSPRSINVWKR